MAFAAAELRAGERIVAVALARAGPARTIAFGRLGSPAPIEAVLVGSGAVHTQTLGIDGPLDAVRLLTAGALRSRRLAERH